METATMKVKGIHCESCKLLIKDSLDSLGIKDVSFRGELMKVKFDDKAVKLSQIKETVRNEGYGVE